MPESAPGPVNTERLHRIASGVATRDKLTVESVLEKIRSESPIGVSPRSDRSPGP